MADAPVWPLALGPAGAAGPPGIQGTPGPDFTLTVGNLTTRTTDVEARATALESSGGPVKSAETQAGTLVAPTQKTIWRLQPRDPAKAPFTWHLHGGLFNSTWDAVMYLGYNADGAGGKVVATEPSFRLVIEQDYEVTPGTHWLEAYFEWIAPTGASTPENGRPIFWRFNRATGTVVGFDVKIKEGVGIAFTDWVTDTAVASIGGRDGSYIAQGHPSQVGNTQLSLTAQNNKEVAFGMTSFRGAFAIIAPATSQWAMTVGGLSFMQVGQSLGNPIGLGNADSGQAAAVAIQLKDGVKTFWPTLKLKKIAGQDQNLLSMQDDSNVELAAFTVTGAMQLTEQTAPAAPAVNKVRVYAEDNGSGKTKLMARFATGAAVQIAIEP